LLKAIHKATHKDIKVEPCHERYNPAPNVTKELLTSREHVKTIVKSAQVQPVLDLVVFRGQAVRVRVGVRERLDILFINLEAAAAFGGFGF
jgi:hypothetical protein